MVNDEVVSQCHDTLEKVSLGVKYEATCPESNCYYLMLWADTVIDIIGESGPMYIM